MADVEPVVLNKNHAVRLDEDIHDPVYQRDVCIPTHDNGLYEAKDEWTDKSDHSHIACDQVRHIDFAL